MNSMNKDELKAFLNRPYPGTEDFLQHIIFPIFGQDKFVDEYEKDYLDEPSWQKKAEAAGISHIYTLGHIKAVKPIHLFDVTVSDHVRMARNRVSLQLIIRNILKSKSGSAGAFMVFRYEDSRRHEWRFSFCYKAHEDEKSTDAKRFTFLFGPNHSCRTAAENFLKLFQQNAEGQRVKVEHIREAFSVEALSREFFDKYREHYAQFVLHATGKRYVKQANKWEERTEHAPDEAIMQAFGGDEKRVRDYVKKLLGRIVFLHFLQKKGWMGVPDGDHWGEGKFRFMYKLFEEATAEQQADFVHEVLEHLFFHALNTDRKADNDLYDTCVFDEKVRVPYLNGGLFEEDDADRCFKACTDARFPTELFRDLFAFFEQYNFTIDENDPDDAQVGVDPEMLGRIFESLLEDNKEKGAFYTPKEIVQYMCRRSLTAYLQTDVPKEKEKMRQAIDCFVRTKDYNELRLKLPPSLREQVAERLRTVKICDPAIGSGAFPMGLLRELYLCRIALEDEVKEGRSKSHAEIKKEILQQNIYGVDLDRGAVDIARLRFWLSLVVDEDVPQPLPNLDYKIMQGNSLLERYKDIDLSTLMPPQEIAGDRILSLFDEQVDLRSQKLSEAKRRFYSATSHEEKEHLRSEIHSIIQERFDGVDGQNIDLSGVNVFANPNFFLWHTWFSEVFADGGFDIVIGNPPYISLQNEGGSVGKPYEKADFSSFDRRGDIYCLFYEKGMQLLSPGGTLCFITSNKWMRAAYGEKLRGFLAEHTNPCLLIDFSGNKIFENATVDVNILLLEKAANAGQTEAVTLGKDFRLSAENLSLYVHQHATCTAFSSSESWVILSPIEQSIRRKIEAVGTPLKEWDISIYRGVLTGYNEAFIISTAKRDEILAACQTEDERQRTEAIIRPILRGKDIKRYGYDWAGLWLINTHNGVKGELPPIDITLYPAIKAHLDSHWDRIARRSDQGITPYNLRDCAYIEDFEKPKIMYPNMTKYLPFAYDNRCFLTNQKCFIITGKHIAYLTAFLNSSIFKYCFRNAFPELQGGTRELSKVFFDKISVLQVDDETNERFIALVEDIQAAYTPQKAKAIDALLFEVYGLSEEDKKVIGFVEIK